MSEQQQPQFSISPRQSPSNLLKLQKLNSQAVNQDTIMKSLAMSIASRVSGDSFGGSRDNRDGGGYTDRIQGLSNKIAAQITDLDNRLDSILEKHEKDFLTAYRFHMLKVQKELVSLKSKANENELKTQQDSRINDLEKQTQVFRVQCMNLRSKCDTQEKTLAKLRHKIDELEDDRRFLDYEIRDSRMQNKMLKIALSKQHNECEEINQLNQTTREEIMNLQNQEFDNSDNYEMQKQSNLNRDELMKDSLFNNNLSQQNQNIAKTFQHLPHKSPELNGQKQNNLQTFDQAALNQIGRGDKSFQVHAYKVQEQDNEETLVQTVSRGQASEGLQETNVRVPSSLNEGNSESQQQDGGNPYATFNKDSHAPQPRQSNLGSQQVGITTQSFAQQPTSSKPNQYLEAQETQYEQRSESYQVPLLMHSSQDDSNSAALMDGQNTFNSAYSPFAISRDLAHQSEQRQLNIPPPPINFEASQAPGQSSQAPYDLNQSEADQLRLGVTNVSNLKYMSKISQGYGEGRGPGDLQKTFMYNAKFTQQLFDILELTNRNPASSAIMVQQLFEEDNRRRQEMAEHLREKLAAQKKLNQQKQKQIQLQKQYVTQHQESEVLVQTFVNCINAVIMDKKDRVGAAMAAAHGTSTLNTSLMGKSGGAANDSITDGLNETRGANPFKSGGVINPQSITKDNMTANDKKRIIELFVENDNTLSHLLEFISSKLIDSEADSKNEKEKSTSSNASRSLSYKQSAFGGLPGFTGGKFSIAAVRGTTGGSTTANRQNLVNSQLSGGGEVLSSTNNFYSNNDASKPSSNVNHYNLHIPLKSLSSDIQYPNQNSSGLPYLQNHYLQQQTSHQMLQQDPLLSNSQNNSTMRGDHSLFRAQMDGGAASNNNIQSKATLRLAGQQSIQKQSHFSLHNQPPPLTESSKRTFSQPPPK